MGIETTLQWKTLVEEIVAPYEIEPLVILAIIWLESRGNPEAYNSLSEATGLMQVIPCEAGMPFEERPTIAELKDPRTNIEWGIEILRFCLRQSKGNWWGALYRYTGGSNWTSHNAFTQAYWKPFQASKRLLRIQIKKLQKMEEGPSG